MHEPKQQQQEGASRAEEKIRVLSADGLRWTVREVSAPLFDRRGGQHLMFDGEQVMRRIRTFPANWRELPDDVLYALCDQFRT